MRYFEKVIKKKYYFLTGDGMLWLIKLLKRRFTMARPIDRLAQAARIKGQIVQMKWDALNYKWRKDTEKFDKIQDAIDRVTQANKAIKDRRGIKD